MKIQKAPELLPGLVFFWNAYKHLSTDRSSGFGPGPIPWSSVEDYGRRHELDDETMADLHHHVRAMDTAYLEYTSRKIDSGRHKQAIGRGRKPVGRNSI